MKPNSGEYFRRRGEGVRERVVGKDRQADTRCARTDRQTPDLQTDPHLQEQQDGP